MLGNAPAADPDSAAYKSFADTYKDKFGHDRIPPFTATTYDAAVVIGLAIAKAAADGLSTNEIRSEEHTSELQSLMRISYAVFCLKKKKPTQINTSLPTREQNTINN